MVKKIEKDIENDTKYKNYSIIDCYFIDDTLFGEKFNLRKFL